MEKRSGKEFLMCGKQMNWKQNMVYMLREKVKLSIILWDIAEILVFIRQSTLTTEYLWKFTMVQAVTPLSKLHVTVYFFLLKY